MRIVKDVLTVIFFVLLPIAVVTLVTSKLPVLGVRSFVVLSGSMEPTLPVGSVVYALQEESYRVKDVISYKINGAQTVTHRLMEVVQMPEGVFYRVKGDVNNAPDNGLVAQKDVLGKAVTLIPFLGFLVAFLKTLAGLIALVIVPAFIFIGFEVWNIKKEFEKEIERRITSRMQIQ